MTRIIRSLDEIAPGYRVLYCDLWGCLHDGTRALPDAVAALERFKARGGAVALITNSPRPSAGVALQLDALGAPRSCWDVIVSSGDAAQAAMAAGLFGRRVHHIGPERDLTFFIGPDGRPIDVERVPLAEAEGIVCTGLFDDRTETPDDYRATILDGRLRGLRCCAPIPISWSTSATGGSTAPARSPTAYAVAGGESFYYGKPHPPIYALARARIRDVPRRRGPGRRHPLRRRRDRHRRARRDGREPRLAIRNRRTGRRGDRHVGRGGPDPSLLAAYLDAARLAPLMSIAYLR